MSTISGDQDAFTPQCNVLWLNGDLAEDIDRDTAVTILMNQRDISRDEAENIVDNALEAYSQIVIQAKEKLDYLEEQIDEVREDLKEMADRARARLIRLPVRRLKEPWPWLPL